MELSGLRSSMRVTVLDSSSSEVLKSPVDASLISPAPVRLSSSRNASCCATTVCKVNGRGRRRPIGKSNEQKQKEFAMRKEDLLRKSRGQVSVAEEDESRRQHGEEGANVALLLANGDSGAISVSALQPIDEEYRPVPNLSLRGHRFREETHSNGRAHSRSLEGISLSNGFSELVVRNGEIGKEVPAVATLNDDIEMPRRGLDSRNNGTASSTGVEHIVTRKVEHRPGEFVSRFADDSSFSSGEEDFEEWVEVGLDDDGDEEDEEEEVEYWEGDLPPMTPEEEELLLQEAQRELAELEKLGEAGKDPDLDLFDGETFTDVERAEKERKLAELKALVQKMEEDLDEESNTADSTPPVAELNSEDVEKFLDSFEEDDGEGEFDALGGEQQQQSGSNDNRIEKKNSHRRHQWQEVWELDGRYDEEEEEDVEAKDRGVPAVMRCFDRAKIYVKAGDGGNGVVAFRREKFVPFGGPFGGNGGRGGQVYVEADPSMNSLLPFRKAVHFRAGRGAHGGGKRKEGAVGTDTTVKVPPGTLIREAGPEGKVLLELTKPGQREMLLPGGTGGRGNAAFKTGRNNAPQLAELGEQGAEMWIELELKLVADVGIVGVPNAGKSTLLSAVSAAKPEIANYPFTTLLPNLGVVALDYDATMVVADLPGLLEGAHTGLGLGHEFLRHTERCRVLVHVIDGMGSQPVEEFEAVRLELQLFNPILSEKTFVVAYNKMDIPEAAERWEDFQQSLQSKGIMPFCMSAATGQGSSDVMMAAHTLLKEQKESGLGDYNEEEPKTVAVAEMVRKQRSAPIEEFTIEVNKHTRTWRVIGAGLERFTQMTNWEYFESVRRFQRVLSASGVNNALREKGVKEGDLVIVNQMEFNWIDSEDMSALADWKRGVRGSKVWPH
ncbi:unnamed protein product [Calypogeia fissa]